MTVRAVKRWIKGDGEWFDSVRVSTNLGDLFGKGALHRTALHCTALHCTRCMCRTELHSVATTGNRNIKPLMCLAFWQWSVS